MMFDYVLPALLGACIAGAGAIVVAPRLLFSWYLREVRGLEIRQNPGEAVATYPFA